ncbi:MULTISPECIES: type II toxin-antitoxin system RelE family toxin [unclassified Methanofollis]|uniref:type II toxin-antitoxin system RelE family toxin n=1 Tax=unclassified Methanofollis TaxID=2634179 RepID=UPI00316AE9CF
MTSWSWTLAYKILIDRKVGESLRRLSPKSQRIIMDKLSTLVEDPYPGNGSDKERLCVQGRDDTYRLHISHTYTAFYRIHEPEKEVRILAVMSIEQAHKKYGWF